MQETFIKNIKVLKNAIAERKLVVFAGAGISIDAGVPSWETLIKELSSEINIPKNETDFLRIAQMYYNERQQKEFIDKIRDVLKHKKVRYNEIHEAIFELNPEYIITTNFDDLLEQVIKAKAHPFSVIKKDNEFPYSKNTKLLLKIHGDLEEANLVIKEDDYLEYSKNHPLIEGFIKGIFANKVVVFIGYSFADYNLKIILQSVRNILGHDFQNAYMLTIEDEIHPAKREYLKNKGINIINYNDAGILYDQNYIEQYLFVGRNALHFEFAKRNKTLSDKGAKLLYLIKFITKYVAFEESLVKDDPITQMYHSLGRFDELRVLTPNFLGNLFPFNINKHYLHNYANGVLGSNNGDLTDFFFEHLNAEDFSIKDSYFVKYDIANTRKNDLQKKLVGVLEKLNLSFINYFGKTKNKLELFEYAKELTEKVDITLPSRSCNCLSCLFNQLRIKEFLTKLKEESITETSELKSDLLLAYSNYKAGNFNTSYTQFEEIANKSWQLGKYISYYISKYNIKHLRNMINWRDDNITGDNKKTIIQKIDDLDLDKLLYQIPNIDDSQYKLLKLIRDDEILIETENEINECYQNIKSLYDLYKNDGYSNGPYYPIRIEDQLNKLFLFYTYNYLIKDEYLDFSKIVQRGIEALLICYSIDEKYTQRLKDFDFWTLRLMLLYGDSKTLENIFKKYRIKALKVDSESLPRAIQMLNHLFESCFNESNFLGRSIALDINLSSQTNVYFFQDNFRKLVHNTLLIFGRIEIPEKYCKVITRNFLDFIKTQKILAHFSKDYLNQFFNNIKNAFSYEDFIELLEFASETDEKFINEDFFDIVSHGFQNNCPDKKIENIDLIESIISKHINPKKRKHEKGFLYLWKICDAKCKEIIEASLSDELTTTFDEFAYFQICFENIFPASKFYDKCILELEKQIPKNAEWEYNKPKYYSFTFYNFVNLIYSKDVLNDNIPFQRWDDYPDYWKFFFKPHEFDFSKFDIRFLLIVNTKAVHEKLKELKQIQEEFIQFFKTENNEQLSKIYTEYYLKSK